jgi:hypothetical protein
MDAEAFGERFLTRLDAESLACEAVDAVLAHLDRLSLHLFPAERTSTLKLVSQQERATGRWRETALGSALGSAVRGLTEYAQGREVDAAAVPDWTTAILDTLLRLAAADEGFRPTDVDLGMHVTKQGALAAALATVLVAANRRLRATRATTPDLRG